MRSLKFRAWDSERNTYDHEELLLAPNGDILASRWQELCEPESEYIIEQYTGLKDKNGEEIYEGDIIRICRSYGYGFLPKGAVAVVFYDENECCYKLEKQGEFRLTSKKMVEVIGNIHENPELLEAKNVD